MQAAVLGGAALLPAAAHGQDAGTSSLVSSDFTLTLVRGDGHALTSDEAATFFSRARCACATNVTAELALTSDGAAKLGAQTRVEAQFVVGSDCDNVDAPSCVGVASGVTLTTARLSSSSSVMTSAVFDAVSRGDCAGAAATSTRFWAIVRVDGARLDSQPSLLLTVGGDGPAAPTDVKAVSAEAGLLVSWTPTGDSTTLQGHQVLCAPGPTTASTAAYDTCAVTAPDGGAGPFGTLDPQFVCSDLIRVGTHSVRVHGLENGRTYQIAVVAVGIDGTPSAPSATADGTPAPTVGFGDLYTQAGGTATGCAVAGTGPGRAALFIVLAGLALGVAWRRRAAGHPYGNPWGVPRPSRDELRVAKPRCAHVLIVLLIAAAAWPARAADDDGPLTAAAFGPPPRWNVELRFGPYRPNVDSEFANRGQSARPYEQLFSSSRHLMTQLEIDRQLSHRAGTWAVGIGVGYYKVTAAALSADLQSRSGDETGLRLIPLSAVLVYRADTLRERWRSPLVPYAKVGLDCVLWQISDTSQPDLDGRTLGWHAAAGVTLDLSPLDPEAAASLKKESGVHQMALFFEGARYALDGFGSGSALHVGDTTWFAGLMLEL